jgi:CBS domain-containing protein
MTCATDIMTQNPLTIPIDATVADAVQLLQSAGFRHIPIVNAEHEVIGMLSDRDLRALSVPRTIKEDWFGEFRIALETKVARAMTANVITVDEETAVTEIIELMLDHGIGAVPVVDAERTLIGIVSYVDVLRSLQRLESEALE